MIGAMAGIFALPPKASLVPVPGTCHNTKPVHALGA